MYEPVLRYSKVASSSTLFSKAKSNYRGYEATRIFFINFSFDSYIANISLYAFSCPKFNFAYYFTFEILFYALKQENSAFFMNCKI
jgi:hypothetical protein